MNRQVEFWTDAQLDSFRDGELDGAIADRLRDDLLASADLRRRLARLERADALAMIAMTTSSRAVNRGRTRRITAVFGTVAVAAAVVMVVFNLPDAGTMPIVPHNRSNAVSAAADAPSSTHPYEFVRSVMTLAPQTAKAKLEQEIARQMRSDREAAARAAESSDPLLDAVRRAVNERRTEAVVQLLSDAGDDQRAAGFQMLGESLRSAMVAQSILEQMSPAQQVQACGVWARDLELRPIALRKLRELREASGTASDVGMTLQTLMQDSSLRPWLRSYGLSTGG